MNYCSFFINDKALFGSYPSLQSAQELYSNNVKVFIDLTTDNEKSNLDDYYNHIDNIKYINYQIEDRKTPTNISTFSSFIMKIVNILSINRDDKIYIHCKGGHGRAGIVVACLLCLIYSIQPEKALEMTTKFHSKRKTMRDKWRSIGSPQTSKQKLFVIKICKPLYFFKAYRSGSTMGLSNFSRHQINIPNVGIFPTSTSAFFAYKNINDKEYIEKLQNAENPQIAKSIGIKYKCDNWDKLEYNIMEKIIKYKIKQHPEVLDNMVKLTGLRPLVYTSKYDEYWGVGEMGKGKNMLGKIWNEIRKNYYLNM
tara:strand:- start:471 stop:1400 length:930 start_codon:yes stop_codon:yes gene_type:complete